MKKERGKLLEILNSKLVILVLVFAIFFLTTILAGDVIVKEGSMEIEDNLNSSGVLYVNSASGRVGIGTSSPASRLTIKGNNNDWNFDVQRSNDTSRIFGVSETTAGDGRVVGWDKGSNVFLMLGADVNSYYNGQGNFGIGTSSPTEKLDIDSDAIRIRTSQTPASASATGTQGMIAWDTNYIYICTATNTWKRSAISTW
ncbi:hypothetical protein KAR52_02725 [Candidatus Pacearchaeota archaeon]|nr:hypothetical protein [Candidatus Pacearchaeota archaeon]